MFWVLRIVKITALFQKMFHKSQSFRVIGLFRLIWPINAISGDSRQWSGGRDTPPALWRHRAAHTHTSWSACTTHTGIWGRRSYTGCSLHVPESSYTEWLKHKPRVRPPDELTYDFWRNNWIWETTEFELLWEVFCSICEWIILLIWFKTLV